MIENSRGFVPRDWVVHIDHWTDEFIRWDNTRQEWIGYDENDVEVACDGARRVVVYQLGLRL